MAPDEGQGVPRKHKRKRAEDAEDEAQKVKVTSEKQHAGADPEDHNVAKKTKKKKNREQSSPSTDPLDGDAQKQTASVPKEPAPEPEEAASVKPTATKPKKSKKTPRDVHPMSPEPEPPLAPKRTETPEPTTISTPNTTAEPKETPSFKQLWDDTEEFSIGGPPSKEPDSGAQSSLSAPFLPEQKGGSEPPAFLPPSKKQKRQHVVYEFPGEEAFENVKLNGRQFSAPAAQWDIEAQYRAAHRSVKNLIHRNIKRSEFHAMRSLSDAARAKLGTRQEERGGEAMSQGLPDWATM